MNLNKEELQSIIDFLETNPKIIYDSYPQYPKEISVLLASLDFDIDYFTKYEDRVSDLAIEEMNLEDIKVMFTFIQRGERFCDGNIASYVEDETLLKLAKREIELLNK